jgi:hypothetical protein
MTLSSIVYQSSRFQSQHVKSYQAGDRILFTEKEKRSQERASIFSEEKKSNRVLPASVDSLQNAPTIEDPQQAANDQVNVDVN